MWKSRYIIACVATLSLLFLGCSAKGPSPVSRDYKEMGIRLIALMPVDNTCTDEKAQQILRQGVLERLYFKGYPKIPLHIIDEKITDLRRHGPERQNEKISPQMIGSALGVDAVLCCTLSQWKTSYAFVYATTRVAASFELKSAKTGEILWSDKQGVKKRHYGVTKKSLEIKSKQSYEPAVQDIITKAMETFPNGPDFVKNAALKKRSLRRWFRELKK